MKMSVKRMIGIGVVLLMVCAACGSPESTHHTTDYTNTIAAARTDITNLMAQYNIPGCTVVLVDGQRVVWAEGFGYADVAEQKPVTTNTVMMIGSVSKLLTAVMALQGVDEGAFDLDASITNYVPEFSLLQRFENQEDGWTLRTLLDHHSGIPEEFNGGVSCGEFWPGYTERLIAYLKDDYPSCPPKTIGKYCNNGFNIVGEAISRLDGVTYMESAENRVFEPLGMTHSSFLMDKATVTENLSMSYSADGELQPVIAGNITAAGGAFSRPLDMAQVMKMMLADGMVGDTPFLSNDALMQMGTFTPGWLDVGSFFYTGLGLDTVSDPVMAYAGAAWQKGGAIGGYLSLLEVLPDQQLGVFVNINCSQAGMEHKILGMILTRAVQEKSGLTPPAPESEPTPVEEDWSLAELQAIEGYYVTGNGVDLFTAETDNSLTWMRNVHSDKPIVKKNMRPHEENRFFVPESGEWQLIFTNRNGVDIIVSEVYTTAPSTSLYGSRYTPASILPAWEDRCDTIWIAENMLYNDLTLAEQGVVIWELSSENGVLFLEGNGQAVLNPENDTLAFTEGYLTRGDSCVRIVMNGDEQERLLYSNYSCVRMEDIPELVANGASASASLSMHTNALFKYIPVIPGVATVSMSPNAQTAVLRVINVESGEIEAEDQGTVCWESGSSPVIISVSIADSMVSEVSLSVVSL